MLIQDLQFLDRVDDVLDIQGGATATANASTSADGGKSTAYADASGTGLFNTSLTGTITGASPFYSYGAGYGAAYGAEYIAIPGLIKSDIKSAYATSISSDVS